MSTWPTHLWVADEVLERLPQLHRRGFCVGSIAPDCNVENADWTVFTPPRQMTHWMGSQRKVLSDCDRFWEEYAAPRYAKASTQEERSFLLGYYAHLLVDALYQQMIRDEERVKVTWRRIKAHPVLSLQSDGMPETYDSIKPLLPKAERLKDVEAIEAVYLANHPQSAFVTEILPLQDFPDYLDFLPQGAIVRKIRVMGHMPASEEGREFIAISLEEYHGFVKAAVELVSASVASKMA